MRALIKTVVVVLLVWNFTAFAQRGDKRGEHQVLRVPKQLIPPAPRLSPEQALRTFRIKDGLQIECVAHEPLVETPVAMTFGPDGRMWVVEMRGFMPNIDGRGEQEIPGRVAYLEDTNEDGRMDKKTMFLDDLKMPRAIALTRDGVLVGEPPHLWFCRDTNGDGKADSKTEVASDYGDQKNPEHTANGLLRNLDNWTYNLYHTFRYRDEGGKWVREATPNRAQWGISQDDFGRLFYTSNGDHLRGDLLPAHYFGAKLPGAKLTGVNVQIARDQSVWPGRVNPGVNRAYEPKTLRSDYRLARFTAACGTLIYRGDLLGPKFYGNAFVCEPAGNMIRRDVVIEQDGLLTATNAYIQDEFLTSTDERFRPVNLSTGPDGAIYVVDMYHGIIQHRTYVTSYLRQQIVERGLEKPLHQGRIYRIAPVAGMGARAALPATVDEQTVPVAGRAARAPLKPAPRTAKPNLSTESSAALVQHLAHANGWWRDTAQRILVERGDDSVVSSLKALADPAVTNQTSTPLARLHALWTLEGMGKLDVETIEKSLGDPHTKIRAAAIRLAEPFLAADGSTAEKLRSAILSLVSDTAADLQIQLALTLGQDKTVQALSLMTKSSPSPIARELAGMRLGGSEQQPAAKTNTVPKAKPLTPEEQTLFVKGKEVYEATCLACHQPHGMGQEGLAPPLVGAEWVASSPGRLIRIVLHGMRGPIKVKGQTYELDMPSLGVLDDEQIAGALTYIRREWGHTFSAVTPAMVKKVRADTEKREDAWSEQELLKIP